MDPLQELYDAQAGVVTRAQLLSLGHDDNDVRRLVRRRELTRLHQGVYYNHTGPPSWVTRAWGGVLFYGRAALCSTSAVDLAGDPIHVAIEHPRNGAEISGVVLHRLCDLDARVRWNTSPPRLRIEEAALDVAAEARTLTDAVGVLTRVCQRRMTHPQRLLDALHARPRLTRGVDLRRVLADVADGANSVLEREYLVGVERRHGLPRGTRQVRDRADDGVVYRDVLYQPWGLLVEVDGWQWHGGPASRSADMSRDLTAAVDGLTTLRVGRRQVHDERCGTAWKIGLVLNRLGWQGAPRPCGPLCPLRGRSQSRGA